ncbi:hypothetical protein [Allorhizocola rhizosphaerae]|uniref:hypothetical protein n=1 Tax=Allorhizocola rhizosphaerae TaxID=1872709 RepID=UPI000E3E4D76|nr:hypothetical protein [Allorhizocola rhizosphaerae]
MIWSTAWEAYDVPRLWDAVRGESAPMGWEQVFGLQRRADLMGAHADGLRARRELLAEAWQGPSAGPMLGRWDALIATADAEASTLTLAARGLHGIMSALSGAKKRIEPLQRQWNDITSDWIPEYWEEVAAELNDDARTAMLVAAAEIRDHRSRLGVEPTPDGATSPPPALPGYRPASGALAGAPAPVPALAGQPVSMLPIPPGNPYAPQGGAYLLPGPGVGPHGMVVQMAGGPPPASTRRRSSWEIAVGVPPVIQPVTNAPGKPTAEAIAQFDDWFKTFATPWRAR